MAAIRRKSVPATSSKQTEFTLRLYDDRSTREKLTKTTALEIMFADPRNVIPAEYIELCESLVPGDKLRIAVERISQQE